MPSCSVLYDSDRAQVAHRAGVSVLLLCFILGSGLLASPALGAESALAAAAQPVNQRELAAGLERLGHQYRQENNLREGRAVCEAALTLRRALAARNPADLTCQSELAASLHALGHMYRQGGGLSEGGKLYAEAVAVRRALLAAAPGDAQRMSELSTDLGRQASIYVSKYALDRSVDEKTGEPRLVQARYLFEEAVIIMRELVAREPDNQDWRYRLAGKLGELGEVYEAECRWLENFCPDRSARAKAVYAESVALMRPLVAVDPANADWLWQLSRGLYELASVEGYTTARAQAVLKEGIRVMTMLAGLQPENQQWQGELRDMRLYLLHPEK